MKGMFKKFRKGLSGRSSTTTPSTPTANTPNTPTNTTTTHTTATPITSPPTSPPPSTTTTISSLPSSTPNTSQPKSGTSSSSSPSILPSLSTPTSSHSLPLDNTEGRPIGKKSISSLPRTSTGPALGEKKDGGGGAGVAADINTNGGLANGVNGQDDDDDDEPASSSSSSPHQLTRADLLKPIPSLNEPSTPPQSSSSPSSSASSPSSSKQALFLHKLRLCCITFDWSKDDPSSSAATALSPPLTLNPAASKDARAKESKRVQLLELLEFVGKAKSIYNEQVLQELMRMIAVNLFRALPPRSAELPSDEDEPVYEASWVHLQVVYELFLRFIVNNDIDVRTLKKHIHAQFVLHLLELFDSEDHRERDYLKTILHRIYAKFMSLRAFIRKAINHVFYTFIYEQDRHSGIAELLEILGSIINGFALPLKHEHKLFLRKVLIPMHKVRSLHHFHQQLSYCVSQFVDKDPELAVPVLSGLLHYWPIVASSKEVLFLNELEQILELTQPEEFGLLVPSLFRRVAACIASPHFQVAERALFLWHNEYISHLIAQHREEILPILYPVLCASPSPSAPTSTFLGPTPSIEPDPDDPRTSPPSEADPPRGLHWNPTVNNLTVNVLKIFVELDAGLVESVRAERKEKEQRREKERQWRDAEWKRLEEEGQRRRTEGLAKGDATGSMFTAAEGKGEEPDDSAAAVTFTTVEPGDDEQHQQSAGQLPPAGSTSPSPIVVTGEAS